MYEYCYSNLGAIYLKGLMFKERHRTSKSCWRNDGTSRENLHSDDQSKQVVHASFSSRCF